MSRPLGKYKKSADLMFSLFFLGLAVTVVLFAWGISVLDSTDLDSPQRNAYHKNDVEWVGQQIRIANYLLYGSLATAALSAAALSSGVTLVVIGRRERGR